MKRYEIQKHAKGLYAVIDTIDNTIVSSSYEPFKNTIIERNELNQNRTFENEEHILRTFTGYQNNFCIELNAKIVHSVKSEQQHFKKLKLLVDKYQLIESSNI